MSFSPIIRVRNFLDKMKTERDRSPSPSPLVRLKRSPPSRSSSMELTQVKSKRIERANEAQDPFSFSYYPNSPKYYKEEVNYDDKENQFDNLPVETVLSIISFIDAPQLLKLRLVNKEWCQYADDELLWKNMCIQDFGVLSPLTSMTWKRSYFRLDSLFAEGVWEGMSKWVEPPTYDNEQKTTAKLGFAKRSYPLLIKTESTTPESKAEDANAKAKSQPDFLIHGSGVTINCASPSPFAIEGERLETQEGGISFSWDKRFEKHTSVYTGTMDFNERSVKGTISYDDGTIHWKGVFFYTKVPSTPKQKHKNRRQVNA